MNDLELLEMPKIYECCICRWRSPDLHGHSMHVYHTHGKNWGPTYPVDIPPPHGRNPYDPTLCTPAEADREVSRAIAALAVGKRAILCFFCGNLLAPETLRVLVAQEVCCIPCNYAMVRHDETRRAMLNISIIQGAMRR